MDEEQNTNEAPEQEQGGGNALKAIRATDDELVVGNYIVLFGGRDLEGVLSDKVNEDGSKGEFFTSATEFDSAYTSTGALYVDWAHGQDPDQFEKDESARAPGRDEVLGTVNWKTAKADNRGVWVERVLNRRNAYMQYLEALIDDGLVGNSSEAVSAEVEIKANGEISRWPLKRDALTVTPMEPRMLTENSLAAIKALADEFPTVKSLADAARLEAAGHQEDAGQAPSPDATATVNVNINIEGGVAAEVQAGEAVDQTPTEKGNNTEDRTMSENENVQTEAPEAPAVDVAAIVKAAAEEAVKAAIEANDKAWQERLDNAPPVNSAGGVVVKGVNDEADRALKGNPFRGIGDFLQVVARAEIQPNAIDKRLLPLQAKAPTGLNEGVPSAGGFLVQADHAEGLLKRTYETGDLMSRVRRVGLSANSNRMTFNAEDETSRVDGSRRGGIRSYWTGEASEKTASAPKFRQMELNLHKLTSLCYATDELLQDASALQGWIMDAYPEETVFKVEDALVNGTGAGQPLGLLSCGALVSVAKETGQAATTLVSENVIKMWARMWARSRKNAIWIYNQDIEPQLFQMELPVGTGGQLVYMPPGGLSDAPYGSLFGRPMIPVEYCKTLGTVGDLMLVDFSQVQAIDKGGIDASSSIHVRFIYDETVFRFVYRYDAQPTWNSALTPHEGTNTLSPYVALASRA